MKRINRSTLLYPRKQDFCAHIYNETWKFNVYLYWPITHERMLEVLKNWEYDGEPPSPIAGARTYSFTHGKGGRVSLLMLGQWSGSPRDHAFLAHEAMHVVADQFAFRGIPIHTDNDEPAAYTLEWLVESSLSAIEAGARCRRS